MRLPVFGRERLIGHGQINDEFDKSDNRGYKCPKEQEIQHASSYTSQVEFVDPKSPKEKS